MAIDKQDEKYKEQFRKLAGLFETIEAAALQYYRMTGKGYSILDVDSYLQLEGVNVLGAGVIIAMIRQSNKIQFDETETGLIPLKRFKVALDDGMVELLNERQ